MDDPFVLSIPPRRDGAAAGRPEADTRAPAPAGGPPWLSRIPVRSVHRIVIVPVGDDRAPRGRGQLRAHLGRAAVPAQGDADLAVLAPRPAVFLRVHRSHAVNLTLRARAATAAARRVHDRARRRDRASSRAAATARGSSRCSGSAAADPA